MVLGESPSGEYDIRLDIQRDAAEFRIPLTELDINTVTFTWPDSMYELVFDEAGQIIDGVRTNRPRVYLWDEIPGLIEKHRIYDNYLHYIEAQVWDRDRLNTIWREYKKSYTGSKRGFVPFTAVQDITADW
jgi:hypothetical protein